MSEGKTPQGHEGARGALADWPTAERSAIDWDEAAERVVSRIESGESPRSLASVSDEDLFAAPLPESTNEVQNSAAPETLRSREAAASFEKTETRREGPMSSTPSSRERDRASLKDLAKLASLVPPASSPTASGSIAPSARTSSTGAPPAAAEREENSGVINLAALAASEGQATGSASVAPQAAASQPAPSQPVASQPAVSQSVAPQSAVDATSGRVSAPAPAPVAAARSTPAAATTLVSAAPATAPSSRTSTRWIALGGVVAAAAVAAAVFVGMHRQLAAAPVAMNAAAATAPSPASPAQAAATNTVEPSPIPAADRGVDPSSLPEAVNGASKTTAAAPAAFAQGAPRAAAQREPQPVAAAAQPATPPAAPAASVAAAATPPPPAATATAAASDQSLQALMQQAAGVTPSTTPAAPAAAPAAPQVAPGSVPLKPSLGAIEGALGTALPGARACLGPDDPISHAMVTFRSDGSVESVSVSGHAAGTPAEPCIRSALMKARVTPFAEAQFSAPVTVRPN